MQENQQVSESKWPRTHRGGRVHEQLDDRELFHNRWQTIDPEQKNELRSILDELMGWLKNENDALGEHTSAKESVVYNIIAIILSILVGSGGGGIPSPQPDGTTPSHHKKKEDEV